MTNNQNDPKEQLFYDSIVAESKRSVNFKIGNKEIWISRDLIEDWSNEKKYIFIPSWLYDKHFI